MPLLDVAKSDVIVPSEGDKNSKIAIIGEAPGSQEAFQQRPFVGPAGSVLATCLHAAGLIRSECYLTNLFPHRIIKKKRQNKADIYHTNGELLWHADKGFTEQGQEYIQDLRNELLTLSANVFVPLGNAALEAVTGKKGIYKQRGSILDNLLVDGKKAIPTIHPAATLYGGDYLARYYIIFDLIRIKKEQAFQAKNLPDQNLFINPTLSEVLSYIAMLKEQGFRVNYDIEIINQEISAISLATNQLFSISIPFDTRWTVEEEVEIWNAIQDLFEDSNIPKVNQNISFDNDALLATNGIIVKGKLDDPMTACGIIYPDFPKGLDFLTSIYTRVPYYKDEGKIWFKGMGTDIDAFYRYSAQDSACSIEAMNKLDEELDSKGYRDVYEETIKLYEPLAAMMYRGINVDRRALMRTKNKLETERDAKQEELNTLCKFELNVKSSKQKIKYFYTDMGIKPFMNKGRKSTDEKAMVKLATGTKTRPAIPEAQLVVDITKIRSVLEKYMNIQFDPDGRLRCQVNPRGTTTGRISTGKKIRTNTGANMQNLTQEFKSFLKADPGYTLLEFDKVQGEWVVVAYYSGDARMINVVEKKLDAHATTGKLITGLDDIPLIQAEAEQLQHETNPDIIEDVRQKWFSEIIKWRAKGNYIPRNMTIRQCGKRSNHGCNYGMGYKRSAREWEIPEHEAKQILPLYHKAYPGVENGFQAGIIRSLSKDRTVTNCFGRKREFLNKIYWTQKNSKVFEQAFGFLPQSTVADLINKAMIATYEDTTGGMQYLEMLMQVHDSILFQFPLKYIDLLPNVIATVNQYLNPVMNYFGRDFQIETELKAGTGSWSDLTTIPTNATVDTIKTKLAI